jgi:hypothetical protein
MQQASLFLVAITASGSAVASTCGLGFYDPANGSACVAADPGSYVPNPGATAQIQADPGFFVPNSGSSAQIQAQPGSYVPNTGASVAFSADPGFFVPNAGATVQQEAPIGFYVPTSGAAAATPVSQGFYTASAGASAQMPAGGLAAPLTAALQTSTMFNNLSTDLLEDDSVSTLKLATAYQHNTVDQVALSSGNFDTDIGAVVLQANLLKFAGGNTGVQFAYGHHNLDNSGAVDNNGNSFEVAAFQSGMVKDGRFQAFLVYGQTHYDNRRNVVVNAAGTNLETLTSDGDVSWAGVRSRVNYPVADRVGVIGQFGVLRYSTDRVQETGVATLSGAPTASVASLNAKALNYISAPVTFGVSFDALPKTAEQSISTVTLEAGVTGNLSGTQNLRLALPSGAYRFNLPVTQSSAVAGLFGVKLNGWQMGNGFNVTGALQTELGVDTTAFRAGINLVKSW